MGLSWDTFFKNPMNREWEIRFSYNRGIHAQFTVFTYSIYVYLATLALQIPVSYCLVHFLSLTLKLGCTKATGQMETYPFWHYVGFQIFILEKLKFISDLVVIQYSQDQIRATANDLGQPTFGSLQFISEFHITPYILLPAEELFTTVDIML